MLFSFSIPSYAFFWNDDCTDKSELDEIQGNFCILKDKDGPITCIVVKNATSGGIDCTLEGNIDLEKFEEPKSLSLEIKGEIERRVVKDRICYFYNSTEQTSHISCVKVQFK